MECDPSFGHFQIVLYHESAEIRKELLSSAVNYSSCMPRLHFFGGKQIRVLLGVADCIYNQPGLQSAHFSDHMHCLYRRTQDSIICH
jgi:hypothetical protein